MRLFRPKRIPPEIERAREVIQEVAEATTDSERAVRKYWKALNPALAEVRRLDTRRR